MILGLIVGLVAGSIIGAVALSTIAAGAREDAASEAVRNYQRKVSVALDARGQFLEKEAARWRDRALLCEEKGPTCGEVDEVFKENVRLKAEIAVLKEPSRN